MNYRKYKEDFPLILSATDVCTILGVSRISVYNLCHSEDFPSMRVGKRILIPRDSFFEWIEMQTMRSA